MYCIIKCIVQGKQGRVKTQICVTRPQCVKRRRNARNISMIFFTRHNFKTSFHIEISFSMKVTLFSLLSINSHYGEQ